MNEVDEALFAAIREAQTLRNRTRTKRTKQVQGSERDIIRATSLAWVNNHRKKLLTVFSAGELSDVDGLYQQIMEASHRAALRSKYVSVLKSIGDALVKLRSDNLIRLSAALPAPSSATNDLPPDFSKLITDAQMQEILKRRWTECTICIGANAPLAATVMMGGLLEGLLLARVNREQNKTPIFTAAGAPKDRQGKTLPLKDWTLQHYIDVGHELKWISQTAKDIGVVLRDYRNYIHPQKELTHGVNLSKADASLLWEISKSIARQLLV
jgi:hypothetical protein